MLKIKLIEVEKHRNETTFRKYIQLNNLFNEVGINFTDHGNDYDMVWIAQASFMDKSKPYDESVKNGIKFVEKFKGQDIILIDGQDSATLMGSWDVFKETDAKLLLKNTMYKNVQNYSKRTPNGRIYWNHSSKDGYSISPNNFVNPKFHDIKLSGTNWLSTVTPQWYDYSKYKKDIDVFAMFQYPASPNSEWEINTAQYYTEHRRKCIEQLHKITDKVKIVTAENGKVPIDQYYNLMSRSKIVVAPFGYGEIAPRDIESSMLGCVLIKSDMEHINTIPNIYSDPKNFMNCKWDFSDLNFVIDMLLPNFHHHQQYFVENLKRAFNIEYNDEKLVEYIHGLFERLDGYGYC
jgi:hypothetical protein